MKSTFIHTFKCGTIARMELSWNNGRIDYEFAYKNEQWATKEEIYQEASEWIRQCLMTAGGENTRVQEGLIESMAKEVVFGLSN